ncbi:phosphatidate cytidylyltransferase [Thiorhodovibrio frisius]|uniref:Putative CDP-diglyceride synthetase/phosphatidate cytidylyltransferase n=1 Tax=Thiorhodovibrio frisius TaxID=631362 RepID=H8Z7U4_9GAMM|nr:phosphatidate cytidylyltransferase [Thiorhodovibrio frisius]EIC20956.1 putative CDP-diglyceride synthetase/phosphatidate cytidylyltransferase [Thiorhodovibrio frisius]WPL22015.1 Phosphatidate cytidylyltransferase [Thiorhodovibrio frisius]
MNLVWDQQLLILLGGIAGLLILSSLIGLLLDRRVRTESARAVVDNLNARIRSWWVMTAVFVVALATGGVGSVILFGLVSFVALREFITLTPTRRADHRTLFWAFFVFAPVQYVLVGIQWYGLFVIFIPVYAFLFVPVRSVLAGDTEDFLARTAKIQWGLMIAVYCVSHAPALLMLQIPGYEGQQAKLLLFLIVVVQLSDVLQYVFGKTLGKHRILPRISPNKTWEGTLGGIAGASLVGALLWWTTPFTPWTSGAIALLVCTLGFTGGLVMSAIKRDRGIKDFGSLIEGHGGMMDRIDSLCFAAPVFFHVVRYFYG